MIGRRAIVKRLWAASEYASYGDTVAALQVVRDLIAELERDQTEPQQRAAA